MPNAEAIENIYDHRTLTEWSEVDTAKELHLPNNMVFNDGHRLSIIVYSILMVISTIGNTTVLVLLTKRRLRGPSRIDIMLMHLAIADLLVTLLLMPLEIAWAYTVTWNAGDFMCRLMSFFRTFGLYLSSFVLVCISIDRFYAVLKPLNLSSSRGKVMLSFAWMGSIICSAPQAIIFHLERHPKIVWYEQCVTFHFFKDEFHEMCYQILGMLVMYALPLVIILFCYTSIYVEIYRKSKRFIKGTDKFRRSNDDVLGRAKRRTLKMTVIIVIVFIVCWTPYYIMCMWWWLDKESALKVDQRIQKGLFLFAVTNSCMNPIVYGAFNIRGREQSYNRSVNNRQTTLSKRFKDTQQFRNGRGISSNSMTVDDSLTTIIPPPQQTSLESTTTATSSPETKLTVCISCGDSIELPNLQSHNSSYHQSTDLQ
ncbi:adipokinetic hormone/corazonin-related peptide receptor variant I isoform X1 [Episyrphus balteatus]|uniref:adipokinetic hormone/corazonin-related peptide receptor variant I isoform X1 n=1 Tax=Episyrphus balteatus TaxID=286459 RepID=UPI002486C0A1|nr:adipokinetic hormone/corazonin-related peptide receptor variant I isoform X1 [Episyrphus balteatus]